MNDSEVLKINFDDSKIVPALGYTWSHFVNIRIGLQYVDDDEREVYFTGFLCAQKYKLLILLHSVNNIKVSMHAEHNISILYP